MSWQAVDDNGDIQGFWRGLYYLFWLCHTLIGLLLMSGVSRVLSRQLPATFTQRADWPQLLCAGAIGALCFAPIAGLLEYTFAAIGVGDSDAKEFRELLTPGLIAEEFFELLPPFVVSWLLLNLGYQSLHSARSVGELPQPEVIEATDGRLIPVSRRKERLVREEFSAMFRRTQPACEHKTEN